MAGACCRQRAGKRKAVGAVRPGKLGSVQNVKKVTTARGKSAIGHPGHVEKVCTWRKTGLITGRVKVFSRRIAEDGEMNCCDDPLVKERDGQEVCLKCGTIVSDLNFENRMDYTKDRDGRQVRHAEPVKNNFKGTRTVISPRKKDGKGRPLSAKYEALFTRLSKIQKWYGSDLKRSFSEGEKTLHRILGQLGFSDPRGISWEICIWVAQHKISQGRTMEATTAAAVYVAAVESGYPVSYTKIVQCSNVREARLRRVVAMYLSKRPAGRKDFPVKLTREKFFATNRHLQNISNELDFSPRTADKVSECVQLLERRYPSGHRPENKAAAAVKAIGGDSITWKKLEQLTGVNEASLKAYWRKVTPLLGALGYLPAVDGVPHDYGADLEAGL